VELKKKGAVEFDSAGAVEFMIALFFCFFRNVLIEKIAWIDTHTLSELSFFDSNCISLLRGGNGYNNNKVDYES
jgi:hypothetical protein